jgi:single-stranded-DNA-specific exonuclease
MAAGFSVANDVLGQLEAGVEAYVAKHQEDVTPHSPEAIDAVGSLTDVDGRLHEHLGSLAPFGPGNPRPRFLIRGCTFDGLSLVGNRRQHLKGFVRQSGASVPFIAFRMGRHLETFEEATSSALVCQIGFDDWRSAVQVQGVDLVVEDAD